MADLYQYVLKAGVPTQATVQGKMILVDEIIGADGVDITPMLNNSTQRTMPRRKKAFKCWTDFDAVVLQSDTDCTVLIWLAKSDVSLGFADGAFINVAGTVNISNDQGSRVPVDLANGVVNVNAANVGINNDNTKPVPVQVQALATLVNKPSQAVNAAAPLLLVGDATLKRLYIRNESATARVALGGSTVTLATAAIILEPGDTWIEDSAAGAGWYAISSADGADVRVMGVKP